MLFTGTSAKGGEARCESRLRLQPAGVNHLGFQVESDEELRSMRTQLEAADARMVEESDFHTLGRIPVYGAK